MFLCLNKLPFCLTCGRNGITPLRACFARVFTSRLRFFLGQKDIRDIRPAWDIYFGHKNIRDIRHAWCFFRQKDIYRACDCVSINPFPLRGLPLSRIRSQGQKRLPTTKEYVLMFLCLNKLTLCLTCGRNGITPLREGKNSSKLGFSSLVCHYLWIR